MGSMERSFTDQSTLQEDERMALSFMDAHTCGTRSMTNAPRLTDSAVYTNTSSPQLQNAISNWTHTIPQCNLVHPCLLHKCLIHSEKTVIVWYENYCLVHLTLGCLLSVDEIQRIIQYCKTTSEYPSEFTSGAGI